MRRFDKKEKIRKANILLEERMKNLKEYGSEFGPEGEFDDAELQGQEDFYDNMNKETIEDGINPITGYDLDKTTPGSQKQTPHNSQYEPTTYSSREIEKSREALRNNRHVGEGVDLEYKKLKQLKESFDKTYNKIKRLDEWNPFKKKSAEPTPKVAPTEPNIDGINFMVNGKGYITEGILSVKPIRIIGSNEGQVVIIIDVNTYGSDGRGTNLSNLAVFLQYIYNEGNGSSSLGYYSRGNYMGQLTELVPPDFINYLENKIIKPLETYSIELLTTVE